MTSLVLPIQPLWQRNPTWAKQRLGTINSTTIGSDGCVVTSASMLGFWYGYSLLPNQVDDFLTDNKLYSSGNLFVDTSISKLFPNVKHDKTIFCENTPAPIADIKAYIDAGHPVFVWLYNNGVRHCTLAVGYDGNQIIVNDPWMGDQVRMNARWGDSATSIIQVNYFTGTKKQQPSTSSELDAMRIERDRNWNLYQAQIKITDDQAKQIADLKARINNAKQALG